MKSLDQKQYIARLESQNDHLIAQLESTDLLLKKVGFEDGLSSLSSAARELLALQEQQDGEGLEEFPENQDTHRFDVGDWGTD